ncbi:MFS transporter [Brevibacterium sp.]|uniref:MFS transporter n=1 Tax=Brevibacterium sp. TaxID=1701 RepID=UPI0025C4C050|nr:MFS transporter [Brevibacterium sp.]
MFTSLIRLLGWTYLPISLVAKLPFAMSVVAVMTSVSALRGSYTEAGTTAALVGLGTAVSGPLMGAAADRWGQRGVLLALGVANCAALLGLAWALVAVAPSGAIMACGLAIGLTAPQASSMVRTRWLLAIDAEVPGDRRSRATSAVLSYESMMDELMFVFGPVIVGLAAVAWGTVSPVVGAAVLTAGGVTAFALHRSADYARGHRAGGTRGAASEAPRSAAAGGSGAHAAAAPSAGGAAAPGAPAAAPDPVSSLLRAAVLLPVLGMVSIGLFFGFSLTSLTAFMETQDRADATGILYGVMGVGSAVFALGVVALPDRFRLNVRWLVFASVAVAGCVVYSQAQTLPVFVGALLLMGTGVGPSLVTLFSIASANAPRGRMTTVMATMTTGVVVGQSGASAVGGAVLDTLGLQAGLLGPLAATLLLLGAGITHLFTPDARGTRKRVS